MLLVFVIFILSLLSLLMDGEQPLMVAVDEHLATMIQVSAAASLAKNNAAPLEPQG
jgi:hypothetical protein